MKINSLTSLRFFFAFLVFLCHCRIFIPLNSNKINLIIYHIFEELYLGVSFFYILSGFILSLNYQDKFLQKKINIKSFYIARIARIYPLHILTFIISIPLTITVLKSNFLEWIITAFANVFLIHSFIPVQSIYFSFNGVSWSISNEMFFYFLFPILIYLFSKWINSKYKYLILFVFLIIPILTTIIKTHQYWTFYVNPLSRVFDFLLGIIIYNLYKSYSFKKNTNYTILELSSIILFIIFFLLHSWIPEVARFSFYYWLPMSYLILIFSYQKGIISKFLSNRILIYLGEISFGFYLIHQLVIRYTIIFRNKGFVQVSDNFILILSILIVTLLLSHISYLKFEKPLNKKIKHKILN